MGGEVSVVGTGDEARVVFTPAPRDEVPGEVGGDRDALGRRVREVWVAWAKRQPSPKPSWLVPYDELSEADKEADRCIGAALWGDGFRCGLDAAQSPFRIDSSPSAPGEVVLWRFHGTAGFRTPAWNEMYCYEGCGCRPYVAVPLAQREVERRVLEAAIRWLSARQDDAESIVALGKHL